MSPRTDLRRFPFVSGLVLGGLLALAGRPAAAQSLSLSLGAGTLRFADAHPGTTPMIPAVENPVGITVNFTGPGNWVLTVLSGGDLESGSGSIPISRVRWTGSGAAFRNGTLSKTSAQTVASGNGSATGALTFYLQNSWTYAVGNYSQTLTFTAVSF